MEAKRDCYEVLGIKKTADDKEIKKAYRRLAKKYHPDTNSGNVQAEQRFKEVTEAYSILSDPQKRKLYDRFGYAAFEGGAEAYGSGGEQGAYDPFGNAGGGGFYERRWSTGSGNDGNGSYREYHFEGGGMDGMFEDLFGGMFGGRGASGGSDFAGAFKRRAYGARGSEGFRNRRADLQSEVTVSFEEAAFGCDKVLKLQGTDGRVQTLQVHIPAGIEDGKRIRLRGKGAAGLSGGESGDLFLTVRVLAKPGFERKGMDVYTTLAIPFTTAVFGGEVQVQTIDGTVLCRVREGTQSGTRIRLKGKGIVSMKDPSMRGDQYVTVQIEVPRKLGAESEKKLREYEQSLRRERQHRNGSVA